MAMSCHVVAGELNPDPLQGQPVLLTAEPLLQPFVVIFRQTLDP